MSKSQREKELTNIITEAREELQAIQNKKRRVSQAHLLGKCFSYAGKKYPAIVITDVSGFYPRGFEFYKFGRALETDHKGESWRIVPNAEIPNLDGWVEVRPVLFENVLWRGFLVKMIETFPEGMREVFDGLQD